MILNHLILYAINTLVKMMVNFLIYRNIVI